MDAIVLDASATLSWCYEDEQDAQLEDILIKLAEGLNAYVPSIWLLEVYNSLCVAHRRKRISWQQVEEKVDLLSCLGITITHESSEFEASKELLKLAKKHQLSSYNTCYLLLAIQKELPLATTDKALRTAAKHEGVRVLPR